MAPSTISPVFCTPNDVYDYIGVDGAQLRLDDTNQASGQEIRATAAAAIADTSISVTPLTSGLLRGTRLVFSFAEMAAPVTVTLSAVAQTGTQTLSVNALDGAVPSGSIAFDNGVNVWLGGLLAKACQYATSQVMDYCCTVYNANILATSQTVNRWSSVIAARWIAKRRTQAAPQGIESDYEEILEDMRGVRFGRYRIGNIGTRTSGWPFFSNVSVNLGYTVRKVRVEQQISETTQTQYPQAVDFSSYGLLES